MITERNEIAALARHGIILPDSVRSVTQELRQYASDAADLSPTLATTSSAGIPAFLTNRVDPRVIEVLVAPMAAAKILPEVKKGDWTTSTQMFIVAEAVGQVATYGDWSPNGKASANFNYPSRQNYLFQTFTEWGERELALAGEGYIDLASQIDRSSALVLAKFLNRTYLFGVAGLQNYGLTNDPALPAPVAATVDYSTAQPEEISNAIVTQVGRLVAQSAGIVDGSERMVAALPPSALNDINRTNSFGLSAAAKIRETYPLIEFVTVPEYDTAAGRLIQIWVPEIDGTPTGEVAFSEKMRAHVVVPAESSYRQKKSAGTYGAVIYRPFLMTQEIGI